MKPRLREVPVEPGRPEAGLEPEGRYGELVWRWLPGPGLPEQGRWPRQELLESESGELASGARQRG